MGFDDDPTFRFRTNWTPQTGMPVAYGPHPMDQVIRSRRETRHGLHLVISILTFGVWAFTGWPIAWAWNRFGPRAKTTIRSR